MGANILRISKGGFELLEVELRGESLRIGRDPSCDGVLRAPGVKPFHFLIKWRISNVDGDSQGGWVVYDVSGQEDPEKIEYSDDITGMLDLGPAALSSKPVLYSGFTFRSVHDGLASRHFGGGFMKREVAEAFPLPPNATYPAKTDLLLEVARVDNFNSRMAGLRHIGHDDRGKIRALPFSSPVKYRWIDRNTVTVFFNNFPDIKVFSKKAGEGFVAESGMRAVQLTPQQHLLIKKLNSDIYVRLLPATPDVSVVPPIRQIMGWTFVVGLVSTLLTLPLLMYNKPPLELSAHERTAKVQLQESGPIQLTPDLPPPSIEMRPQVPAPMMDAQATNKVAQERARQSGPPLRIREKSKPKAGLNSPALDSGVNSVGVLGFLKKEGTAQSTRVRPDLLVNSERVGGNEGAIPVVVPRAGSVEINSRNTASDDELQMASSTLSSSGDLQKDLSSTLNEKDGRLKVGSTLKRKNAVPGIDEITITGGLKKNVVQDMVSLYSGPIKNCYDRVLVSNSRVAGKLAIRWIISPAGKVTSAGVARSEVRNSSLETCVLDVIRGISFPVSAGGVPTTVLFPFVFNKKASEQ